MTGTAKTSSEEFYKVYGLDVISIPTNKPIARVDRNDQIFQTETGKYKAIAKQVAELNKKGQPVLIGTVSIEKNEVLSEYLRTVGVPHELLNAKNHEREGEIIAQAGRRGAVTVATNMAGRGVDIKLGGNPPKKEEAEAVKAAGGLFVLGTERHEARRIDNQLRGRSGRQGDLGETQFFVSMEDTLMRVFAADTIKNVMGKFGIPEDEPIENRMITRSLESAQTKIEGFNFDSRKHVLEYDNVLNHQRTVIYERRCKILLVVPKQWTNISALLEQGSTWLGKRSDLVRGKETPTWRRLLHRHPTSHPPDHRPVLGGASGGYGLPPRFGEPARLRPARPTRGIQKGGAQTFQGYGGKYRESGDAGFSGRRWRSHTGTGEITGSTRTGSTYRKR